MKHDTLIRADALKPMLGHCVVIDVRHQLTALDWGRQSYAQGHIPGAHFMDMEADLSGPRTGRNGRHPLPDPQALSQALARAGVQRGVQVVVYDQNTGAFAARLWWLLRHWFGHDATALLEGGWDAWLAAEGPVSVDTPPHHSLPFTARPEPMAVVQVDALVANLQQPHLQVVDARTAERFEGRSEPIDPVAGHIPGALNRPLGLNLGPDGLFKPAALLAQEWQALLAGRSPQEVVHQCGSGVTACHNLLAMEVAGLPGARVYPGSWSEWCADPTRPVATGP